MNRKRKNTISLRIGIFLMFIHAVILVTIYGFNNVPEVTQVLLRKTSTGEEIFLNLPFVISKWFDLFILPIYSSIFINFFPGYKNLPSSITRKQNITALVVFVIFFLCLYVGIVFFVNLDAILLGSLVLLVLIIFGIGLGVDNEIGLGLGLIFSFSFTLGISLNNGLVFGLSAAIFSLVVVLISGFILMLIKKSHVKRVMDWFLAKEL